MLLSFFIILLISLSGTVLTYVYEKDDRLLERLAAGNIIGSGFFGLIVFLAACVFGFSQSVIIASILVSLIPLCLLFKNDWRTKFSADFDAAKSRLNGATFGKLLNFLYYFGFLILFYFFFDRVIFETPEGIFTGGSNNLGDLPFHLGAIYSFIEGDNFPPENPSFAFAKFTYPFMADLIAACFIKLGASVRDGFLVQNVTLALSLIVLFEKFTFRLVNNRLAGKIANLILLFSGGLGFIIFFRDYLNDGRDFAEFLWNLPKDYTILPEGIRWGNSLTTLFLTQRGLLLGLPLTLIILTKLWQMFSRPLETFEEPKNAEKQNSENLRRFLPVVFIGLLAGTLPLVHVHSLALLFFVCAVLFFFRLDKWREWIIFGVSVAVIAIPELVWTLTGSASNVGKFIGWHFGWHKGDSNVVVFWAKNVGLFAPLLVLAIYFYAKSAARHENAERAENEKDEKFSAFRSSSLLVFYIPFGFVFILSNLVKLAPWEWDNIKLLIYWFIASVPLVAWLLAKMWRKNLFLKIISVVCLFFLTFAGVLDVWRTVSEQVNYIVFSRDAINIAAQIKEKTPPKALFLNAPAYNSAIVLTGRRSFMRYIGHLSSYGIDYEPRYDEVKRIYEGSALAESLLEKNRIDYLIISPEEPGWVKINQEFFEKYPVIAESGQYRVYQIK